jgi:hypothetical protein
MEKFSAKDKQIIEDMKQCVKDLGLKILGEEELNESLCIKCTFEHLGNHMECAFAFKPLHNMIDVNIRYSDVQIEKITALYELLNHINTNMCSSHFCIETRLRMILLQTGFYVTGYFLNRAEFKSLLNQLTASWHVYYPLIIKLITTDQTPQAIMDEFYAVRDKIASAFLDVSGGHRVTTMANTKYHFTIEASTNVPALPTHTHGMTKLGMPEFLIDHLAAGPQANAYIINCSCMYFMKPENREKLEAIKGGETIQLTIQDIYPEADKAPHPFCYRRVYPEFEMVKQAYNFDEGNDQSDADPEAWFVQIYVEGDDFALTDDYYKDGIKW